MGRHARQGPPERGGRCRPRPLTTLKLWIESGGVHCALALDLLRAASTNRTAHVKVDTHAPYIHMRCRNGDVVSSHTRRSLSSIPTLFWWRILGAACP